MRYYTPSVPAALTIVLLAGAAQAADTPLIRADRPVTVGLRVVGGEWRADLTVREATTVTVACPASPGRLRITGLTATATVALDERRHLLDMRLPPGTCSLGLRPHPQGGGRGRVN